MSVNVLASMKTMNSMIRTLCLAAAVLLAACGGGGGGGAPVVVPPPVALPAVAGHYATAPTAVWETGGTTDFLSGATADVDATGFMMLAAKYIDWSPTLGPTRENDIRVAGRAVFGEGGGFEIPNAVIHVDTSTSGSSPQHATVTGTVTGRVVTGHSLVFTLPAHSAAVKPSAMTDITVPFVPNPSRVALASAGGFYVSSPSWTGSAQAFTLDAATGRIEGEFALDCRLAGTVSALDSSNFLSADIVLTGTACPAGSGQTHRFLGEAAPSGMQEVPQVLSLTALVNGQRVAIRGWRNGNANIGVPDGSASPLPGFTEPRLPAVAALPPFLGRSNDPSGIVHLMVLDASGRFVLTLTESVEASAQNVIVGTMNLVGNQWTATGAQVTYRARGATTSVAGTVDLAGVVTPVGEFGNMTGQVTLTNATVPLLATQLSQDTTHAGYAGQGASLPHGAYFSTGRISIDSTTGRVRGTVADGCLVEGVIAVTDGNRNVYRLRVALSGSGCAAAGYAEASGDLVGYLFVPLRPIFGGTALIFEGILGGRPARIGIGYPNPMTGI
jgi:hypothetical protein